MNDDDKKLSETARMPSYNDILTRMSELLNGGKFKSVNNFVDATGLPQPDKQKLYRTLNGDQQPRAAVFVAWLDKLGARIQFPDDADNTSSKEVCFVAPKALQTENGAMPKGDDYLAVPLAAGPVAAGRGMIPEDQIKSWVLVWRHHESVRFRTDLIAVEIGRGQNSMEPTLHQGDILLVDRADFHTNFSPPGNIFLVREPDGSVLVKRVTLKRRNGDTTIILYSDNSIEHTPLMYSLNEDYEGDISRAVIGRVVWAWSDMSQK